MTTLAIPDWITKQDREISLYMQRELEKAERQIEQAKEKFNEKLF